MRRMIVAALLAFIMVPACGGTEESGDAGRAQSQEQGNTAPPSFTVQLDPATTAENVVPRIVAAAHGHLADLCAAAGPGASVSIANPLASGAYTDVSCASVLDGDGPTGEASSALFDMLGDGPMESVGPLGWSPIGLGCSLIAIGIGGLTKSGCEQNYPNSRRCGWEAWAGSALMGLILCQIL